ncbi:MAG: NAD-glutamate dehydrogenase, partial [Thermaurantiacus sp.]
MAPPARSSATKSPRPGRVQPASASESAREAFASALRASAPSGELEGLDEAGCKALVDAAFETFAIRAPGTSVIHVGSGEGDPGARRMQVTLVTDDRPFLVDSTTGAVTAAGLDIYRLLHPVIPVRRDEAGIVIEVGGEAPRESVIVMEVERAPARRRAELQATLEGIYEDVAVAVADWQAMLAALRAAARRLNDQPPPIAPHLLSETIAFLDWIAADNFTFLGVRGEDVSLGLFRQRDIGLPDTDALGPDLPVVISKSPDLSTVHRRAPLDVLTVRHYDSQGRPTGASHFVGLFTSIALSESPRRVPLVRRKVAEVTERLGYDPRGHAGKALGHVIETFPREELFQVDADRLTLMAEGLLSLLDRPRPRLFLRVDAASRTASVIVYVPRDAYSSDLRVRIGAMLESALGGRLARYEIELRGEGLARVHFVFEGVTEEPDEGDLNTQLARLTRGWNEALEVMLAEVAGPARAARLALTHGKGFSLGYRSEFSPAEGAEDILRLAELSTSDERLASLYRRAGDPETTIRLKVYRRGEIIPLSDAVPTLENFGFRVIEEVPFDLAGGRIGWIHDFKLEVVTPPRDFQAFAARVEPALAAVLSGAQENDAFNALIPAVGLDAVETNWLRALFRYLRQTGVSYGVATVVDALKRNRAATEALVGLFRARHDPAAGEGDADAAGRVFDDLLAQVDGIDDDRILRLLGGVTRAILRTNAFAPAGRNALAFKLDCAA